MFARQGRGGDETYTHAQITPMSSIEEVLDCKSWSLFLTRLIGGVLVLLSHSLGH